MMKINRRNFIRYGSTGLAGIVGLGVALNSLNCSFSHKEELPLDIVKLGETVLTVPRIAMGTGTTGFRYRSNQSDLGKENFIHFDDNIELVMRIVKSNKQNRI